MTLLAAKTCCTWAGAALRRQELVGDVMGVGHSIHLEREGGGEDFRFVMIVAKMPNSILGYGGGSSIHQSSHAQKWMMKLLMSAGFAHH